MRSEFASAGGARGAKPSSASPKLIPCLLLRKGAVCLPSDDGPVPARSPSGALYDLFEVVDRLAPAFSTVYVVDLDGIEKAQPQLDYLQELSRDVTIWVDGGVRNSDQAIDILVAGASKAILSSATIEGPKEVRRPWRLSSDLAFELELGSSGARLRGEWPDPTPLGVAATVREAGVTELVLSPREIDVDWLLVRALATGGPVWVNGTFSEQDAPQLAVAQASGGIFHIAQFLGAASESTSESHAPLPGRDAR